MTYDARRIRREDFSFHRVGKFSLWEHSVFSEGEATNGNKSAVRSLRKIWLGLSVSFA